MVKSELLNYIPKSKRYILFTALLNWLGMVFNVVILYSLIRIIEAIVLGTSERLGVYVLSIALAIVLKYVGTKKDERKNLSKNGETRLQGQQEIRGCRNYTTNG